MSAYDVLNRLEEIMFRKAALMAILIPTIAYAQNPRSDTHRLDLALSQAKKEANLNVRAIKNIAIEHSAIGYQITINYDPKFFVDEWSGREQSFANADTYHLAQAFVKAATKNGMNMSIQATQVCANENKKGPTTGKEVFVNLGCSMYDPPSDSVSPNDNGSF
ncbi:hypothetical protein [Burkholderia vietnamiensis]|uniref:hypothetical protein n=1 Tax=Burkholderia vietnamiensis TaxID=60552 RepID=UPI001CC4F60F|nr:hypothetical protein [Burkholderia vietnamiensis]